MGFGDADVAAKKQQQQYHDEHAPGKLSSSGSGSDKHAAAAASAGAKRRQRGNFYGKHLWGADPKLSGELDYVRRHGEELLHKVLNEDENWKYVSLKQVHDVRLYTPIAAPEDDAPAAPESLGASGAGRSLSSTSASSAGKERASAARALPGRCDFRAMTRVSGTLDTVMEVLAADDDREAYWTALNTLKGLRAHSMFGSRRLAAGAPFPRWSQRYLATRFTKYSTKSVDVCFAEYAKVVPPAAPGGARRGFIYRRSVDEGLFEMGAIKARLAKYDDECERMYIQDWLFEVAETPERGVCKVVLSCSVYFSGDYSRSLRAEFHEAATDLLVQLRKVLARQWQDAHGEEPAGDARSAAGLLAAALRGGAKPGQARYCSVCSAAFSLLRKRYTCRACCAAACSKCVVTVKPKGSSILGNVVPPDGAGTRECALCFQFGDDAGAASRSSASAPLARSFATDDGDDFDDLDANVLASSSRSILSDRDARKLFGHSGGPKTPAAAKTPAAKAPAAVAAPKTPAPAAKTPAPRKPRNGSSDSTTSSRSDTGGVVLFSDLDALTLSGRVVGPSKRPVRTVSEDNVLHARDGAKDAKAPDDDLANFNLKLL